MLKRLVTRLFQRPRKPSSRPIEIWSTSWMACPHISKAVSHVVATGDVHGQTDLLAPLLDHVAVQAFAIPPKIVVAGNLIDHGLGPIRAFDSAEACGNRYGGTVLLPDNHEIAHLTALDACQVNPAVRTCISMGGGAGLQKIGAARLPWPKQRQALQGRGGWDAAGRLGRALVTHGHTPVAKQSPLTLAAIPARAALAISHGQINFDPCSDRAGMAVALDVNGGRYRMRLTCEA